MPDPRNERLLNGGLLARAYGWLGPMQGGTALVAFFFVLHGAGWHYRKALSARDPIYMQTVRNYRDSLRIYRLPTSLRFIFRIRFTSAMACGF